jgi:PAS domain S-box-containing protein
VDREEGNNVTSETRSMYQEIVECLEEGIWKVDRSGKTSFVNQRIADMLGYSRAHLMSKSLFDFIPSDEKQKAAEVISNPDAPFCVQRRFVRSDGKTLWFRVTSSPSFGADGEFAGRIGVIADISQDKAIVEERDRLFSESLDLMGIAVIDT